MWHKPQVMNWVSSLVIASATLILLYAVVFVVVHLPVFPIERVRLAQPLKNVTDDQVRYVLSHGLKGNFFTVDLEPLAESFKKLPWVREVSLRRRWPNVLEISLEEHQALARWGDAALLNTQGQRFSAASGAPLPVFYGAPGMEEDMVASYHRFLPLVAQVGRQIQSVHLDERRAWILTLDSGLTLELGREQVEIRLQNFIDVYPRTIATLPQLVHADLRYPNGFAVRMKAEEAPLGMKPQKPVSATKPASKKPAQPKATPKPQGAATT